MAAPETRCKIEMMPASGRRYCKICVTWMLRCCGLTRGPEPEASFAIIKYLFVFMNVRDFDAFFCAAPILIGRKPTLRRVCRFLRPYLMQGTHFLGRLLTPQQHYKTDTSVCPRQFTPPVCTRPSHRSKYGVVASTGSTALITAMRSLTALASVYVPMCIEKLAPFESKQRPVPCVLEFILY
jgi:hypothetical protein